MMIKSMSQCGTGEIAGLCGHGAENAMLKFCEANWKESRPKYEQGFWAPGALYGAETKGHGHLFCHYIFTAGVYKEKAYSHYGGYGEEFAKFIEDNKLGKVVTTEPVKNLAFHPDHCNQVWVWSPDEDALWTWYQKKQEASKPKVKEVSPLAVAAAKVEVKPVLVQEVPKQPEKVEKAPEAYDRAYMHGIPFVAQNDNNLGAAQVYYNADIGLGAGVAGVGGINKHIPEVPKQDKPRAIKKRLKRVDRVIRKADPRNVPW